LLERFPDEISGHRLTERRGGPGAEGSEVTYGEAPGTQEPALVARVANITSVGFSPGVTTAGDLVVFVAQFYGEGVLTAGRDGSLGWVYFKTDSLTLGVSRDIYLLLFCNAPSQVVFSVEAGDPVELAALVQAMVSAAR